MGKWGVVVAAAQDLAKENSWQVRSVILYTRRRRRGVFKLPYKESRDTRTDTSSPAADPLQIVHLSSISHHYSYSTEELSMVLLLLFCGQCRSVSRLVSRYEQRVAISSFKCIQWNLHMKNHERNQNLSFDNSSKMIDFYEKFNSKFFIIALKFPY